MIVLLVSTTVLVSGVMLVVTSMAFWLGALMGETWMGFAIVGGCALAIGAGVSALMLHNLVTRRDVRFPETREQIRRDVNWLDEHLGKDASQNSPD